MHLNINHIKVTIAMAAAFFLCSSMTGNCHSHGPETEVNGIVSDAVTGKPIGNLPMELTAGDGGSLYFTTNADGSYDYKFSPDSYLKYQLVVKLSVADAYLDPLFIPISQGRDTTVDYKLFPVINVTVHLINSSSHGQTRFSFDIADSLDNRSDNFNYISLSNKIVTDTVAKYKLAQYTNINCKSNFYTPGSNTANIVYQQNIKLGGNDTTIVISNP
jgi:hypothetical protein